ncbi:MAG: PIN domain-containing protein [Actinomycetota bacterium]|nr:PIN domain-containing protein [Actinomycetota bacterium]
MILADTSAWIEFLRATGSPEALRLRRAIADREVVVVDPVVMEVMAGARRGAVDRTKLLLESQHAEALQPKLDWLDAATIFRELRRSGVTVRSQVDALIAAAAIRLDLPVLHRDRDYDAIAQHTTLRVVGP